MRSGLKKAREQIKMTVQEAAELIGVTPSTLYKWEQGTRDPSHSHMKKSSEIYQKNIEELFFNYDIDLKSKKVNNNPNPAA